MAKKINLKTHFQISVDTDDETGQVLAVYLRVRAGRVRETREFAGGKAYADYDVHGHLIGIEILEPCRVSIVDKIAEDEPKELRKLAKKFMKDSTPSVMIAA